MNLFWELVSVVSVLVPVVFVVLFEDRLIQFIRGR